MTDNQAKKDRLVQEGVSKYDFEVAEAVVAVDTYFKESRPGESFGSFLLRDDWIDGSKVDTIIGLIPKRMPFPIYGNHCCKTQNQS